MSLLEFKGKLLGANLIVEPLLPVVSDTGEIAQNAYCRVISVGIDVKNKSILKPGAIAERRQEAVPGRMGSDYLIYPKKLSESNCYYLNEGNIISVFSKEEAKELIEGLEFEQMQEIQRIAQSKQGDLSQKKDHVSHKKIIGQA